jgi:transcriptional regulator with XRE-family HTH domain
MKMRGLSLTLSGSDPINYFAMSETKENEQAFLAMFAEMRRVLKKRGWSQRRVCAAVGRSESWLSKILHAGRGMDITDLLMICRATGIPPSELLSGYPCPEKSEGESEAVARRIHELLPSDIMGKLIELEQAKK